MDYKEFCYFPVLKTKDAELRAIQNLNAETIKKTLPIFEITKSRISKYNKIGDISKRMDQLRQIQGDKPFILDVTTEDNQKNSQTESMLTPGDGYYCWREMLAAYQDLNIIPAIHINLDEDDTLEQTKLFVRSMVEKFPRMALRLPCDLDRELYHFIINSIRAELGTEGKLYILLDEGCIRQAVKESDIQSVANRFSIAYDILLSIPAINEICACVVCISGSFPQHVAQEGGGDESGSFKILEHYLYEELSQSFPGLRFGDYASVNINQVEMRGGTFIPRIDFCTNNTFFYHRFRRNKGSYIECAKKVVLDQNYQNMGTWGDKEIANASNGTPTGISPSFWISVRINNYITKRVRNLDI